MRIGSSPAAGVLIAVGAGVAVLMALWPLMVAFSEAAAFGLAAVAVLAVSVLVADWAQASPTRRRRQEVSRREVPRREVPWREVPRRASPPSAARRPLPAGRPPHRPWTR